MEKLDATSRVPLKGLPRSKSPFPISICTSCHLCTPNEGFPWFKLKKKEDRRLKMFLIPGNYQNLDLNNIFWRDFPQIILNLSPSQMSLQSELSFTAYISISLYEVSCDMQSHPFCSSGVNLHDSLKRMDVALLDNWLSPASVSIAGIATMTRVALPWVNCTTFALNWQAIEQRMLRNG